MESQSILKEKIALSMHNMGSFPYCLPDLEVATESDENFESSGELNVSFGYQCSINQNNPPNLPCKFEITSESLIEDSSFLLRSSSFSCLSGAALSANATLANTNIFNGIIGGEILPVLDSPNSFKRLESSPSLSRLDSLSTSPSSKGPLVGSISMENDLLKPDSAPPMLESSTFLNATNVQMAGGAAGEDRVQAVCSEENGWLFCGVYDGFNGRDAADFLASTFYEYVLLYLHYLEYKCKEDSSMSSGSFLTMDADIDAAKSLLSLPWRSGISSATNDPNAACGYLSRESAGRSYQEGVLSCLAEALAKAENEFMDRVEEEMDERPDLVSVGSSVLAMLLQGSDLYVINLGDSRAVLATCDPLSSDGLLAIQLSEIHSVDNETERQKVLADHRDDPSTIMCGKVKGKLKLTRAVGVGYLKKKKLNNALMGILRVQNLRCPPYVYTHPFTTRHEVSDNDLFIVLGSDGLFDFFTNDEVIQLVYLYVQQNPCGDPAKYLVEQLVLRAAGRYGLSVEALMSIPVGRRRKYHDDVTVIVIMLGNKRTSSKASTCM